jgi:hypothetical protein
VAGRLYLSTLQSSARVRDREATVAMRRVRHQVSMTAGTILHNTKTPLSVVLGGVPDDY